MKITAVEELIDIEERSLGVRLPTSLRRWLTVVRNGGEIDTPDDTWRVFPVLDKNDRRSIRRTCNHIWLENQSAREWRGFPENAIAFAANDEGDYLTLLREAHDPASLSPAIYRWEHETQELELVADDLLNFLPDNDRRVITRAD
jgi:hypothetical protein